MSLHYVPYQPLATERWYHGSGVDPAILLREGLDLDACDCSNWGLHIGPLSQAATYASMRGREYDHETVVEVDIAGLRVEWYEMHDAADLETGSAVMCGAVLEDVAADRLRLVGSHEVLQGLRAERVEDPEWPGRWIRREPVTR